LLEIVHALDPQGLFFGFGQNRQQQRRQNGDNGDYYQQLDQGEAGRASDRRIPACRMQPFPAVPTPMLVRFWHNFSF
jgi:hypothetical protein